MPMLQLLQLLQPLQQHLLSLSTSWPLVQLQQRHEHLMRT
jgi:hypothetical protein